LTYGKGVTGKMAEKPLDNINGKKQDCPLTSLSCKAG
jgi:hypothetical protein